ncbi:MAG: MlaE family lipid ABC transporter permease subunit [Clostridia bacterium]|nr:MlaE family lipid ABC transporter permease subunit [Deltaproteobacteria bacterium]
MKHQLSGNLTRDRADALVRELEPLVTGGPLELDMSAVAAIDTAGVAIVAAFARRAKAAGTGVTLIGASDNVARTLALFPMPDPAKVEEVYREGWLERIAERWFRGRELGMAYLILCADILWFTVQAVVTRTVRARDVANQMAAMGSQALGVVGLMSFLIGAVLALQAAAQLRQFGASIFVADLLSVSLTRELGPLITAIMVAGRSGSAVAAEIGTMVITEEIDALHTMGLNTTRFLIVPKAMAITLTQPLLTMYANVIAMIGGFLVAILYLGISPVAFWSRVREALFLRDIITGLLKAAVFANIIVSIGALCGFRTGGGADAVGRSTTTSVVAGIFTVIVADAAFSLLFYFN